MVYEYKPGLGDVGSYQASGKPFLSGSCDASAVPFPGMGAGVAMKVEFPSVTSWVTLTNLSTTQPLFYGFSANGIGLAAVPGMAVGTLDLNNVPGMMGGMVNSPTTITLRVKVCEMFFASSDMFDVSAGLTAITCPDNLPNNWSGSVGVG